MFPRNTCGLRLGSILQVTVAVDAMRSSSNPHAFMGVTEQGLAAIVKTRGNQDVHVILRGGTGGTNYSAEHVKAAAASIIKARPGHHPSIMIDCSREEPLLYALLGRFIKYVYH